MPYDWSNKVIGHEYIRIMRAKVEAGTATEDEKMSSRTEADRKGGQCHIMSQTLSGNISMRL